MATKQEVERFLNDFKTKMSIFHNLFMDNRGKNAQALLDLEISPIKRIEILKKLAVEDYSQGTSGRKYAWLTAYVGIWQGSKRNRSLY